MDSFREGGGCFDMIENISKNKEKQPTLIVMNGNSKGNKVEKSAQ